MNEGSAIACRPQRNAADPRRGPGTAFGYPREFFNNRFVYTVISPRARGLSIGVNMNPDKVCNFDCIYCEVDRQQPTFEHGLDLPVMRVELEHTLKLVHSGRIREHPGYRKAPAAMLRLQQVCLSGDGEPTRCPDFLGVMKAIVHLRARGPWPFFKLVLVTNGTGLDRPEVQKGLSFLTAMDEVWAKLDAGSQSQFQRINNPDCTLEEILTKIVKLAKRQPVVIQSLFPAIANQGPPASEIEAYVQRLKELKEGGAQIPLVQIYSATRPTPHSECGHLSLGTLSMIARRVSEVTGLKTEVF